MNRPSFAWLLLLLLAPVKGQTGNPRSIGIRREARAAIVVTQALIQ